MSRQHRRRHDDFDNHAARLWSQILLLCFWIEISAIHCIYYVLIMLVLRAEWIDNIEEDTKRKSHLLKVSLGLYIIESAEGCAPVCHPVLGYKQGHAPDGAFITQPWKLHCNLSLCYRDRWRWRTPFSVVNRSCLIWRESGVFWIPFESPLQACQLGEGSIPRRCEISKHVASHLIPTSLARITCGFTYWHWT